MNRDPGTGPKWTGRGRAAAEVGRRAIAADAALHNYVAEAEAASPDQSAPIIAAVIVAQALDRLGKVLEQAAAISAYKRS